MAGLTVTGVACAASPGECTSPTTPTVGQLEGRHVRPARPGHAARPTRLSVTADVTAIVGQRDQHGHRRRARPASATRTPATTARPTPTRSPRPARADLAITKTDGTTTVSAGGSTTYTLTVTNNGPSPVSGAILADPAVAGLTVTGVACAASPGECTGGTTPTVGQLEGGTFALPDLASRPDLRASAVTADVTASSGSVANTATVAGPTGVSDPNAGNDSATDSDTVTAALAPTSRDRRDATVRRRLDDYTLRRTTAAGTGSSVRLQTGLACAGTPAPVHERDHPDRGPARRVCPARPRRRPDLRA